MIHDAGIFVVGVLIGIIAVYACVIVVCWRFWR